MRCNLMKHRIEQFSTLGICLLLVFAFSFQAFAVETDWNSISYLVTNGNSAYVEDSSIEFSADVVTQIDSPSLSYDPDDEIKGLYISCSHGEYMSTPELNHFFDYNGYYNLCYGNGKNVYIQRYDYSTVKLINTIKVDQVYPLLGDVVCDDYGYYYVITGKNRTTSANAKINVTKYDYNGNAVGSATQNFSSENEWNTAYPFDAGTCVTAINDGILLCNYAREMYNGHQSSALLQLDVSSMELLHQLDGDGYSVSYTSHSFAQKIYVDSKGNYILCDMGDAYPRAFKITKVPYSYGDESSSDDDAITYQEVFHFYGLTGDNYTGAQMGDIAECGDGVLLCASSKKSMTKTSDDERMNIFVNLSMTDKKLNGATSRKGTSCGVSETDENILWLTNYSKYDAYNPQMVSTDDGNFVIMWEKVKHNNETFIDSYYMIINQNGDIIQEATSMNKIRLNAFEQPLFRDGYVTWTTAGHFTRGEILIGNTYHGGYLKTDARSGLIHKLKVGRVTESKKCGDKVKIGNINYTIINAAAKGGNVNVYKLQNNKINSVTIPNSVKINNNSYKVTKLSDNIFSFNYNLKRITLGKNISTIPNSCFRGSKEIINITIKNQNIELDNVGKKAFSGLSRKIKIKVPKGKVSAYKRIFTKRGLNKYAKVFS